jgi:hypothetical protein
MEFIHKFRHNQRPRGLNPIGELSMISTKASISMASFYVTETIRRISSSGIITERVLLFP